jgi:hypothetical protein
MAKMKPAVGSALTMLLSLTSACTVMVDRGAVQCKTDSDCVKFQKGNTAVLCDDGVCVDSKLRPKGCFAGTPSTALDYLNACTSSDEVAYDNCSSLKLCGVSSSLPDPVTPDPGSAVSATIKPVTPPTIRCAEAGANVIYMTGAADFGPLLKQVTPLLAASDPPYRGVFLNGTSCSGVKAAFQPTTIKDTPGTTTKAASYAFFFDDNGTQTSCTLDPEGKTVDIGVSDLYANACDSSYQEDGSVAGYLGPAVTFGFIVPMVSKQTAISVEAAHLVFGLGGQNPTGSPATPWTNPTYFSIRNSGAASVALAAELIHVPRTAFWGVDRLSSDGIKDALTQSPKPEESIGIVSIDYADSNRGNLRALYLQAEGQISGFLPDSTLSSKDKMNVRDGHYPMWGYVHFYTSTVNGVPTAAAGAFVSRFAVPKLDQALVTAMIDASLVPQCAMKVARTSEMGPVTTNPLKYRCGCYFDYRTTGRASCPICNTNNDCPTAAPACNYGFCESDK